MATMAIKVVMVLVVIEVIIMVALEIMSVCESDCGGCW